MIYFSSNLIYVMIYFSFVLHSRYIPRPCYSVILCLLLCLKGAFCSHTVIYPLKNWIQKKQEKFIYIIIFSLFHFIFSIFLTSMFHLPYSARSSILLDFWKSRNFSGVVTLHFLLQLVTRMTKMK